MKVKGGEFSMAWKDQFDGSINGDTPFVTLGRFIGITLTTLLYLSLAGHL